MVYRCTKHTSIVIQCPNNAWGNSIFHECPISLVHAFCGRNTNKWHDSPAVLLASKHNLPRWLNVYINTESFGFVAKRINKKSVPCRQGMSPQRFHFNCDSFNSTWIKLSIIAGFRTRKIAVL